MVRFLSRILGIGMTDAHDGGAGGKAAAKPLLSLPLPFQTHKSFRPKGGIFKHKANQPSFQAMAGGIYNLQG